MKPIFQPANKEQEEAISAGIDFIENGNPDEFFVIGGKAGTGKTTIAEAILSNYIGKKNILACALSHKAKLVISEKLAKAFGDKAFVSKSIAGALGMNMDNETGNFVLGLGRTDQPIKSAHIIVVDEGSMINEEAHRLIMTEKKKKAKVIYLGDIRQLPPIRETGSEYADRPSQIFYGKNNAILKERIRQGEDSVILPFADYFGDNSRKSYPVNDPVPASHRQSIVNETGALVFADNTDDVIELVLPLYKHAVEKADMNVVKMVTYRNITRTAVNATVRNYIFGREKAREQFVIGDLLMFQDNFGIPGMSEPISNSYEIQVTKVEKLPEEYLVWKIEFIYEAKPVSVKALDQTEIQRHAAAVTKKFAFAKSLTFGTEERSDALMKAWELKNRYAPIDYAYAITSHKSQGSTYNTVIVDERDIKSVNMISNKAKSQSLYTAVTRASTTCIVIDGQRTDGSLEKAIELSMQRLQLMEFNTAEKTAL